MMTASAPVKSGETFVERWRCVDQLDIGLERQRLVVRNERKTYRPGLPDRGRYRLGLVVDPDPGG
jgi:hypothetical protein